MSDRDYYRAMLDVIENAFDDSPMFHWQGRSHRIERDTRRGPYKRTWIWEQREGKPWQADLESAVSEWFAGQVVGVGI